MTITRYPILRSGFVSLTDVGLKKPETPFDPIVATLLGKKNLTPDNDNFYHENIQKLYTATVKNAQTNYLNDIEVQESILKAAKEAFGTKNFFDWIDFQSKNPGFTSVHRAFIIETLKYILGTPRKLHVSQWLRLLEAGNSEDYTSIRNNNYFQELAELKKCVPHGLAEVFVKWIRQEHGYYDFITSLAAIFGNRHTLAELAG